MVGGRGVSAVEGGSILVRTREGAGRLIEALVLYVPLSRMQVTLRKHFGDCADAKGTLDIAFLVVATLCRCGVY
jgi:hypothetical protein